MHSRRTTHRRGSRTAHGPLTLVTLALGTVAAAAAALIAAAPASAAPAAASDLQWQAVIEDQDVRTATGSDPLRLPAGSDAEVALTVDNRGPDDAFIRSVRLEGRVLGMSFFSFSTRVDLAVPAGTTQQRIIQLDLGELGEQAIGLIPAQVALLGQEREALDERRLVTDVRGSLWSAYGTFGLAVAAVTLLLALGLALEIARARLPHNRWQRGVRFLAPGLGLGLTATFTLSATRVLAPSAAVWVPLVLGCGAIAFIIGYLTPTPDTDDVVADGDVAAAPAPEYRRELTRPRDVRELEAQAAPAPDDAARPRHTY